MLQIRLFFTIFMFCAGVSSDLAPVLYIQFPSSIVRISK